ncbi:SAM-dependent methyltransferase (fragment) [Hyella patelloides LEGE 07179]|uniref:SAM-dependent methyltransferase n=1 Tax=Hyella patelloides LEGE 07179 TaxID=945734 RepID=A0A563VP50_9CYAN
MPTAATVPYKPANRCKFTAKAIEKRILETYPVIIQGLKTNCERFVWQDVSTPDELGKKRLSAMKLFLADFEQGLKQERYLNQELPNLNFASKQLALTLCSHLLFTYSEQFSDNFHLRAIQEMCRVAQEVRIFPLLENFTGEISCHLEPVKKELEQSNYQVKVVSVDYEFQKKGNQMLVIKRTKNAH